MYSPGPGVVGNRVARGTGSQRSFVCEDHLDTPRESAKVTIFGNDYHIQASENPEYIEKIARYVDGKMRELQGRSTVSSSTKIAILVAMNIADELHRERRHRTGWQEQLDEKTAELARILEEAGGD